MKPIISAAAVAAVLLFAASDALAFGSAGGGAQGRRILPRPVDGPLGCLHHPTLPACSPMIIRTGPGTTR